MEARLSQPWLNPWRTVYFCLRTMPLRVAVKLPVFIYGRVRLFGLNGRVEFEGTPVKTGMVKIGLNRDSFTLFDHSGFVQLGSERAKIIFEGPAVMSVNSKIRVVSGTLRVGRYVKLMGGVRVVVNGSSVTIGENARVSYDSSIMDSGFHHIWNERTRMVKRATRPVVIGAHSWVSSGCKLLAGAMLDEYSIVCANSLICNDLRGGGTYPLIAGSPARVIATGYRRVYSDELEFRIIRWFREHPGENTFHLEEFDDTVGDLPKEFFQRVWC